MPDPLIAYRGATYRQAAVVEMHVGFLFGLGFDTASTIAFLLLTATAALAGISPAALMALPFGFMAAMTLCETVNGVAMMKMYGSAVVDPRRRIGFNMVITGVSAASACSSRSSPSQGYCT